MYIIKHVFSVQEEDQKLIEPDNKTSNQRGGQMGFLGKSTSHLYVLMYFMVWHTWNSRVNTLS